MSLMLIIVREKNDLFIISTIQSIKLELLFQNGNYSLETKNL
jgi:hypothetical protein